VKSRELNEYADRLKHLFGVVSQIDDLEMRAHWSRYLCVLVCGFVETAVRTTYAEYAKRQSSPAVANFVDSRLSEFQNPRMEKVLTLVRAFDQDWAADLARGTEGEIKDAIDSIVANRHLIAHGRNSGVSYHRIKEWYGSATKLAALLEKQCL
jgi:hypothetical protein